MMYQELALEQKEERKEEKRRAQKGFTLIELLVVIAIIAILAAIAIPQFTKYKRKAAVSAASGALAQCISEASAIYADNGSTSYSCQVGDTQIDIVLDNNTGEVSTIEGVSPGSTFTVTYSGYSLSCLYNSSNGRVSCE